ncbi:MAG TPA: alkaline phosphatase [Firmicutes bacterium]|nr:alkaline phosphatase [Bacillota bacterium]
MKKRSSSFLVILLVIALFTISSFAVGIDEVKVYAPVKNVIIMIPDGMSSDVVTLSRWYNGGKALNLDRIASGLVRTYSSDAPIADSAPAATAIATGFKSHTGFVGVLPDANTMPGLAPLAGYKKRAPIANILEAAQLDGKATGLIATSEIMHATPAAFSAHCPNRKDYDAISMQQVYQDVDVVFGGGTKFFTVAGRSDGNDLLAVIKENYQFVSNKAEMDGVKTGKVWGMFADSALAFDFDRDTQKEPSLAEMTQKAIEILSQDEDGFFLMVESSKTDWAAHANDPIGLISDFLAFDQAVGVALAFAKQNGDTVVIAATDHGNSGISIGNGATSNNYDMLPLSAFIDPLKKASLTGEGLEKVLTANRSNAVAVMEEYFGITDLTAEEIEAIKETKDGRMNATVGPMIAKRANIGFTTGGHTGEDVPLYVYASGGVDQLTGTIENTDLARYMEKVMGVSLEATTRQLFVPAKKGFEAKGATVRFDISDAKNPVLVAVKGKTEIRIPVNTNLAYVNGVATKLDGVAVFDGTGTNYVPQSAIDLMN